MSEESLITTEQAMAAAVKTADALTRAAQPTFTPVPTFTPISSNLPTLTPIPNGTPAAVGVHFDVPSDVLGAQYEIESACYFDTQSGWERHEIYAGSIAGSGDEYSAQGVVVVRTLRVVEQDGKPKVELADTQEYLTLEKRGPLRLSMWDACSEDSMLLTTPLNFGWFLNLRGGDFYPYDGIVPLARLSVGEMTQFARVAGHCWHGGCADGGGVSTLPIPLVVQASQDLYLRLPLEESPDILQLSAMLVLPPGPLRADPQYDLINENRAEWSYAKPGREIRELGALVLKPEQAIRVSLEPGYYVLIVLAVWQDHGDVKYAFLVEVKE
ncbi:MAG: hypothetical protein EHM33_06770 [Chloroflexi bacterium]|nr:MAG: hypothetical protein EHM33_06770 [Chloroflexota bacterium]